MPAPRIGTSLSIACSDLVSPNSSAAFAACCLVRFIWPTNAPTRSTGDASQTNFQVQPFSRLMSRDLFREIGARHCGLLQ
ncbi:MAG: hypothetical protein ACXW26_18125 [Allosphingosinicella sp.]